MVGVGLGTRVASYKLVTCLHAHVGLVTSSFYFCTKGSTAHSLHSIRLFFSFSLGLTIQYNLYSSFIRIMIQDKIFIYHICTVVKSVDLADITLNNKY